MTLADRLARALERNDEAKPTHAPAPAPAPPPALAPHVLGAVLKPMLRGDVIADHRRGLSVEQIASARRLPVAVVKDTIKRELAACARERAVRDAREQEVELEIRAQRRERGRVVW